MVSDLKTLKIPEGSETKLDEQNKEDDSTLEKRRSTLTRKGGKQDTNAADFTEDFDDSLDIASPTLLHDT